jgi:hypothetical protein
VKTLHSYGIAERKNQMLMERVKCMIQASKTPHFFFGVKAVNTTNSLVNQSPHKGELRNNPI